MNPTSLICDFVINGSAVNLLIVILLLLKKKINDRNPILIFFFFLSISKNSLENNLNHEEQLDAIWCISSIFLFYFILQISQKTIKK